MADDFFAVSASRSTSLESIYVNLDICGDCMPKLGALMDGAIERSRNEQKGRRVDWEKNDRERLDRIADEVKRKISGDASAGPPIPVLY